MAMSLGISSLGLNSHTPAPAVDEKDKPKKPKKEKDK